MTARDLARFGYLMLRGGNWNGTQIIPSSWVEESTRSYSDVDGAGYGYLWWVNGFGLSVKSFSVNQDSWWRKSRTLAAITESDCVS